jgi:hypothetical protein
MLGATLIAIFFIPLFFVLLERKDKQLEKPDFSKTEDDEAMNVLKAEKPVKEGD